MKVILLQNVEDLGKKMQVLEVKDGYAQNFLFKKKLAVPANEENMNRLAAELAQIKENEALFLASAQETKEKIDGKTFTLKVKGGPEGKLYGAVTTQEIADAVKEAGGIDIDKRRIVCEPIKTAGRHEVTVKLHTLVEAKIFVVTERE